MITDQRDDRVLLVPEALKIVQSQADVPVSDCKVQHC